MNIKNHIKNFLPQKFVSKWKEKELINIKKYDLVDEPIIFNEFGKKKRTFYLCDVNSGLDFSLTANQKPKNILWDRARYNLPIHFYTDDMIWIKKGNPKKKFAILLEPKSLQPGKYKEILKNKEILNDYVAVFTFSSEILKNVKNALPYITGGVYIGTKSGGGIINAEQYKLKTKNISLVSSNKQTCELHRIRYNLAKKFDGSNLVDCFGNFKKNGKKIKIWDSLGEYRYSIVIENEIDDYWITERICNCFASMTIPIYLGSKKIGDFFNIDGIIVINKEDIKNIENIIKKCNANDYEKRKEAILDNFNRVKDYMCKEDWIYNHYKSLFE